MPNISVACVMLWFLLRNGKKPVLYFGLHLHKATGTFFLVTTFLAKLLSLLVRVLTFFLPRWKRLTVRARLYEQLQPFETVRVGNKTLSLLIPDRTCVYWAKNGPDSEPVTNAWIESFSEEDIFVDIGANIGLYALLGAVHGAKHVYAFEPNPFSFGVLARNIVANKLGHRITPLCLAASEQSSEVTFKLSGTHAGSIGNEIIVENSQQGGISTSAVAFCIDDFFRSLGGVTVNHIKLDVDGLEPEILRGTVNTLASPELKSVLVENNAKNTQGTAGLVEFMAQYGLSPSNAWGRDDTNNIIFARTPES